MADPHLRYVQQFEEAEQASVNGRAEAEQARDYFDGNQFTESEKRILRQRKQPITPENLIKPKVESLCGLERQSRTDPKAYPRTQAHDEEANAATDALRYVSDDQDIDIKKSRVFANMLVEGFGGVEVTVRKLKNGAIDPRILYVQWDRLYFDPHSCEADFADASYVGYITWMDAAKAKQKWKAKEAVIQATIEKGSSSTADTYEDKPRWATWYDSKRNRIRINTHYHLEGGVWHRCVFTLAGELEESAPSVFIDEEGNPENPLILQSAYVDRDNDRYGIVRDMIPLQDEVNKRRSKFLHMVNNTKVRVSRSFEGQAEKVRKEMARPDGVIVADQNEIEELGNFGREAGQFQLLQDTRQSLKGIGPNAHMAGKAGEDQSGRAIMAMQQAGMTEMTPLLDNLRHFTLRLYRQVWNRIRQFWTEERWIRVTDDEKNVRFVGLNVTQAHVAMQKLGDAVKAGEVPMELAGQFEAEIMSRPDLQAPANSVAELDVDIDIDEVQETPTLQIEQFESLMQLLGTGIIPPSPEMMRLVIQASNLRDKQKLLEIIDQMGQASQQPNPLQELEVAEKQAEVENTQANTMLTVAKTQTEGLKPLEMGFKTGMAAPEQGMAA